MAAFYVVIFALVLMVSQGGANLNDDAQDNEKSILISPFSGVHHIQNRARRQLGKCSWGQDAVAGCFHSNTGGNYCLRGYICDPTAGPGGRCCLAASPIQGADDLKCPDGSDNAGQCSNGRCASGHTCKAPENFCCRTMNSGSCPTGTPKGRCLQGWWCPGGFYCSEYGWCCSGSAPATPPTQKPLECPYNATSAGTCSSLKSCPNDAACINNVCCKFSGLRCDDGVTEPIGNCVNNQCLPSYQCESRYNLCCSEENQPVVTKTYECPGRSTWLGPCAGGKEGLCPPTSFCNDEGHCCATSRCGNGKLSPSMCDPSGSCEALGKSYVCERPANVCCPIASPDDARKLNG